MHFTYTNYRGETSEREVIVHSSRYMSTEWHPTPQWILTGFDVKKEAIRDFAMQDMTNVRPHPTFFWVTADMMGQMLMRLNELANVATQPEEYKAIARETQKLLKDFMNGKPDPTPMAVLPDNITPDIREVLRMQPWKVTTIAAALRASGQNIGRRHEDETAAVKFLLLQFVLRHGNGWHHIFRKYVDGGITDGMKYMHTLPGYEGGAEAEPPPQYRGGIIWKGEKHAKATCICGIAMDEHGPKPDHPAVSIYSYVMSDDGKDIRKELRGEESDDH